MNCMLRHTVAVQTNVASPRKVQAGVAKSSLVQASVATMQNPMGCEAMPNGHCPLPRLSVSSRSTVVASMDSSSSALHTVMKWKTVLAVFVVVVVYLVIGGLVFRALEQQPERNRKDNIIQEKVEFLQKHPCVTPSELDELIKWLAAHLPLLNTQPPSAVRMSCRESDSDLGPLQPSCHWTALCFHNDDSLHS
ncbi:hypothetical protein JZ751_003032 [Albula glossodonta]|uniref:Uncharacterized protein n=1 Tax=Albula glossodonta TaxID=121402 RepID=A0A8T2N9Q7_9TELE|nr:hypothetical protein JZ751_003032 [Albula glossodonta]